MFLCFCIVLSFLVCFADLELSSTDVHILIESSSGVVTTIVSRFLLFFDFLFDYSLYLFMFNRRLFLFLVVCFAFSSSSSCVPCFLFSRLSAEGVAKGSARFGGSLLEFGRSSRHTLTIEYRCLTFAKKKKQRVVVQKRRQRANSVYICAKEVHRVPKKANPCTSTKTKNAHTTHGSPRTTVQCVMICVMLMMTTKVLMVTLQSDVLISMQCLER